MELPVFLLVAIGLARAVETVCLDRNRDKGRVQHKWTVFLLGVSYGAMALGAITETQVSGRAFSALSAAGAVTLMAGRLALKLWAVRTLGRFHSSDIEIRDDQALVRNGPYRYIRHPIYLSNIIDFIAFPLLVNAFYTMLVALPLQLLIILSRIHFEEKALLEKFGEGYLAYKRKTAGILPFAGAFIQEEREQ